MAKHLDKFTNAFRNSRIPFLVAEVITDGQGTMVDLACRFANDAAGALLQIPAEELRGQRFTRSFPHQRLQKLRALESVAFSGSAAQISISGFSLFSILPMPVIVPPVPMPEQKP